MKIRRPTAAELIFFFEDKTILRQRIYVFGYLTLIGILLIGAFIGRRDEPLNVQDTELKSYQKIDENISLELLNKTYNPAKHLVRLEFKAAGTNVTDTLTGSELSFSGNIFSGDGTLKVIPTISNKWVILISNLNEKFGAIELVVKSNVPQKPVLAGQEPEETFPLFEVTQATLPTDKKLKNESVKAVALGAVSTEIEKQTKAINVLKKQISKGQKLIDFDEKQIGTLQKNSDTLTNAEVKNITETIDNLSEEIVNTQNVITNSEASIKKKSKTVDQLESKQAAIENGKFKFPAKQETGVMKTKKVDKN